MDRQDRESRRAENQVWNGWGQYGKRPELVVMAPDGGAELYGNTVLGLAARYFDFERFKPLLNELHRAAEEGLYTDVFFLVLEGAVFARGAEERPETLGEMVAAELARLPLSMRERPVYASDVRSFYEEKGAGVLTLNVDDLARYEKPRILMAGNRKIGVVAVDYYASARQLKKLHDELASAGAESFVCLVPRLSCLADTDDFNVVIVTDDDQVEPGRGGTAIADSTTFQTAQPDVFVGGDVYTGPRFAIDAIAAGKQGAISIHRYVQPNTSMTIGRNRRDFHELDKNNLSLGEYNHAPRQTAALDESIDTRRSFRDAHLTLTEDQVKIETARCLGCGASVVDPNKCIGWGGRTTKCGVDAIHLHRDLPECSKMVKSEDKFKAILPYMAKREIKIRFSKKEK